MVSNGRRGLAALTIGALITFLGAVGAVAEGINESYLNKDLSYEIKRKQPLSERGEYFVGLEALGVATMIGSGMYLNKRKINFL